MMKKNYNYYCNDTSRYGELHDPTVTSQITGGCGDTQTLYMFIEEGVVKDVTFEANGCEATHACGAYVCEWAEGKRVEEALHLSAGMVIQELEEIPDDHYHCAVLALLTLYQCLGRYLI